MKVVQQKDLLKINNHDYSSVSLPNQFTKHNSLFNTSVKRGLIVGRSGCGKTNVLLSLLLHPNGLRFTDIYLFSKTLQQPKYQFLKSVLTPLHQVDYFEYEDGSEIPSPKLIKPYSIIIFDDVINCNQNIIRDYFCYGRHFNIDCFYLCQTYSSIPKQLIRDNANFIIVFLKIH